VPDQPPQPPNPPIRRVSSRLVFEIYDDPRVIVQVAASGFASDQLDESLVADCDGRPVPITEVRAGNGGRMHVCTPGRGRLTVDYQATITGRAAPIPVTDLDRITYLRPSRYAESDRLGPLAQAEFGGITSVHDKIASVASWVGTHLDYVPGSSGPTDGAVETMLHRQGVCRDYAHLVIALLRALNVPTRLAAVYAPGVVPMDFHAVAECAVEGSWVAVDATLLAPRQSMVRIATGRDAADTAFASIYGGAADLFEAQVHALIDGYLPIDDLTTEVSIS
jgi:transglutaminase-like putative cysteine protease